MRRDVFHAIADPTRRGILSLIGKKPMTPNLIADNFDVSRPAVSQHIRILTECGLITIRKEGRKRYCELKPEKLSEISDWVEPFRELWEQQFTKLDMLLDDLKSKKNRNYD